MSEHHVPNRKFTNSNETESKSDFKINATEFFAELYTPTFINTINRRYVQGKLLCILKIKHNLSSVFILIFQLSPVRPGRRMFDSTLN